jgi:hypothetical protein
MKRPSNYQLSLNNFFMFMNLLKYLVIAFLLSGLLIFISTDTQANSRKGANKEMVGESSQITILVIGFGNNITSNYFPMVDVAEKLEVPFSEYDSLLNQKFNNEFNDLNFRRARFATVTNYQEVAKLRKLLYLTGDFAHDAHSLHQIPNQELLEMIQSYGADFIVVYDKYHLKWQEDPFKTLFHILDYMVYDNNLREITRGQEHFNTFSLAGSGELQRNFQRLARRNAHAIYRAIQPSK